MSSIEKILVLGGASSGKSRFAEELTSTFNDITYLATAVSVDDELSAKIAAHKERRPADWATIEVLEADLHRVIGSVETGAVIVDSLTLYVATVLENEEHPEKAMDRFLGAVESAGVSLILVSDEVGLGVVPATRSGRIFRDLLGKTNQRLASIVDKVYLVTAGLPLKIKDNG